MRTYEDIKKEVLVRQACTRITCDICGREAEFPDARSLPFLWGGVGQAGGTLTHGWSIDGDTQSDTIDLCPDCAKALADKIETRALAELIGRDQATIERLGQ